MNVQIIADSASDLPLEFFESNKVVLLPLGVHLKGEDYEDLLTIQSVDIYEAMKAGEMAKTSQCNPMTIKEMFTGLAQKGETAFYPAFSSELSGTYQTAVMVANEVKEEYPDFTLSILDTKCASLGYGLVVKHAAELAAKGHTLSEIEQSAREYADHMEHLFTVDDLEYLARGGRVSKASAFVGGLLNIKPLLHVEGGKLIPLEKIRGRKKVFRRMIELMKERGEGVNGQAVAISHGDDLETAEELKAMILEEFQPSDVTINMIGSAVGSHSGPGTIALFFLNKRL
ncbi:DegV family EDD domain-containing protein [Bacillus mangrovi]|uniref:DegV family EDD domain-containing protein n=1 Tax=Metabacillus mangrovi TaxID=1491830 RepID=A0A7X2S4U3_9BACI|nr:DegV family protein [Metabacillus mangrovi]MTH53275.1 DegV family EDD domain-containing protein [Metabacillus mangrovi]